ncbi:MAG: hypothetical protein F9K23_00740 [Bacteroidetes bacterium]|nr:MAG: hypothetical protein F9K23_00740 [Bacteroidota bacterium]
MPNQWFQIINSGDVPEIRIIGDIGTDDNEIDYSSFRGPFLQLASAYPTIKIPIHCNGGSMLEGWPITDIISTSPVNTIGINEGMAASMGGMLFLSCKERWMMQNAMVMIHRPIGGYQGEVEGMEGQVTLMKDMEAKVIAFIMKQTGQPENVVKSWMQPGKMTWLNAQQCLQYGIATKIIESDGVKTAPLVTNKKPSEVWAIYNQLNQNKPEMNKLKMQLIAMFGAFNISNSLTESDDDDRFLAKVKEELTTRDAKITKLENELKTANTAKVTNLINTAKAEGKITEEQVANWTKLAESDFDTVQNALAAMPATKQADTKQATPVVDINAHLKTAPQTPTAPSQVVDVKNKATWDLETWQKQDSTGLLKMKREEWDKYAALFEAQYGTKPDKN